MWSNAGYYRVTLVMYTLHSDDPLPSVPIYYIGVVFGLMTTEYSVAEGQGSLAVNVLKLTESSQAASVRFSTQDVLAGKSHHRYPGLVRLIDSVSHSECQYS